MAFSSFTPISSYAPTTSGWTGASLIPNMDLHTQVINSAATAPSASGSPAITAQDLQTTPTALNDSALGSRKYMSMPGGGANVAAQTSVYQTSDIPGWLNQTLANLNAQQSQRSQLYQSILGPLFSSEGNYLNTIGNSFKDLVAAQNQKTASQTAAIQSAQSVQQKLAQLQQQRDLLGNNMPLNNYYGSPQEKLDQQIRQLQQQQQGNSGTQRLGQSAAMSGWTGSLALPSIPALPMF